MPRKFHGVGAGASGDWSTDAPDLSLIEKFKAEFADAVTRLDSAAALLPVRQNEMMSVMEAAADDPDTAERWQVEWDKLESAQSNVDNAKAAIAQVNSWWQSAKSAFGLSGVGKSLGLLQFAIPWGTVAVITAATVALVAVLTSSADLVDSLRVATGGAPSVRDTKPGALDKLLGAGTDITKTLIIAAVALLVFSRGGNRK